MKKGIIILLVTLLAISGIAWRLNANQEAAHQEIASELQQPPVKVQVAKIRHRAISQAITASGTVEAGQTLTLQAESDGQVEKVLFAAGDRVAKGQLLVALDTDLKQANHQLNQLNYAKAKRDYERLEALYREQNASQIEVENARLQMQTSESQLKISNKQLLISTILSPINGIVAEKKVGLGDYLQPGATLATIVDISQVLIRVNLTEKEIIRVKKNAPVTVQAGVYPHKTFRGFVKAIIPQATQAKTFPVEIVVPNPEKESLLVGMEVSIKINEEENHSILALPRTALTGDYAHPTVLLLQNKKALQKSITVGQEYGTWLEVTQGLQPGDLVIVAGQQNVTPGATIPSYSFSKN